MGPEDTEWEGGIFKLRMKFSDQYPNQPPDINFVTKVFHPNVYNDGKICLDILQNQWSPIYDIAAILTSSKGLASCFLSYMMIYFDLLLNYFFALFSLHIILLSFHP